MTQSEFADIFENASVSLVSAWEKGKSSPPDKVKQRLRDRFKINLNWLLCGEGKMIDEGQGSSAKLDLSQEESETLELVEIESPEYAQASAGRGLELFDADMARTYQIPASLLRENWVKPKSAKIFKVVGDSMKGSLDNGSLALLDIEDRHIRSSGIYLIRQGGEFYVKRANKLNADSVELISDNPKYSTITLNTREGEIEILGRVFASINTH